MDSSSKLTSFLACPFSNLLPKLLPLTPTLSLSTPHTKRNCSLFLPPNFEFLASVCLHFSIFRTLANCHFINLNKLIVGRIRGFHSFPKGISPKVNVIARLDLEAAVQHFTHYARTITSSVHIYLSMYVFIYVHICGVSQNRCNPLIW